MITAGRPPRRDRTPVTANASATTATTPTNAMAPASPGGPPGADNPGGDIDQPEVKDAGRHGAPSAARQEVQDASTAWMEQTCRRLHDQQPEAGDPADDRAAATDTLDRHDPQQRPGRRVGSGPPQGASG
jgi:hypothetical protein